MSAINNDELDNITPEEAQRISKALRNPDFMRQVADRIIAEDYPDATPATKARVILAWQPSEEA